MCVENADQARDRRARGGTGILGTAGGRAFDLSQAPAGEWRRAYNVLHTPHTHDEAQAIRVYNFVRTEGVTLFDEVAQEMRSWIKA